MVLCPKCHGACWIRPDGPSAQIAHARENCSLCFDSHERCSIGYVRADIAAEWLVAHPEVAPPELEDEPTKVDCPACQLCRHCHGTHMVAAGHSSTIRRAVLARKF